MTNQELRVVLLLLSGCATTVLVTSAGLGEMVMTLLVGKVMLEYLLVFLMKKQV